MTRTTNYSLRSLMMVMLAALVASSVVAVVLATPTQAATPFTVINTNDSGEGSLRQAILDANGATGEDTINFDPSLSGQTITLGSQLTIFDSAGVIIDGGSANITVSGNNAVRVFDVLSGAKLTLNNLTVANGRGAGGGGIYNNGTLTVTNSTLSGNSASYNSTSGGGIANNNGTVTVTNSTLSGNSATYSGGGISNNGTVTVTNSTLSGNSVTDLDFGAGGGGIANVNGGTVTVTDSTLSGNSAGGGGGITSRGSNSTLQVTDSTLSGNSASAGLGGGINTGGTPTITNSTLSGNSGGGIVTYSNATLQNTIVANSPSGGNCSLDDGAPPITNGGYNLDSDGSCGFGTANHSLSGTTDNPLDPQLGLLANNGGPTLTHALLAGSPAIDKGSSFPATIDQRGLPRPSNFVGIVNADDGSDIGAFERQAPPDTTAPKVTNTTVPAAGAMQVGPGVNVKATFTEAMDASPTATDGDPSTINGTTVKLFRAGTTTAIGAVVSYNATTNTAILNPNSNLRLGTKYKAVVTTGAQDLAGNRLDQNSILEGLQQKTWTFTIRN